MSNPTLVNSYVLQFLTTAGLALTAGSNRHTLQLQLLLTATLKPYFLVAVDVELH